MKQTAAEIQLPKEFMQLAEERVRSGEHNSVAEVARFALAEWQKLESLRDDFKEARAEFERGEGTKMSAADTPSEIEASEIRG